MPFASDLPTLPTDSKIFYSLCHRGGTERNFNMLRRFADSLQQSIIYRHKTVSFFVLELYRDDSQVLYHFQNFIFIKIGGNKEFTLNYLEFEATTDRSVRHRECGHLTESHSK